MTSRLRAAALMAGLAAAGCAPAPAPVDVGFGPNPALPAPTRQLLPTLNIAVADSWPEGAAPAPAPGLAVTEFARGLDHPRWLYELPNGDVLVAESNAPPRPEDGDGIRGVVMKLVMRRAGAGGASADRITLLRDADGDGVAESRRVFLDGLRSPFGMALAGGALYIANTDGIVATPYRDGMTAAAPPTPVFALPAGPINRHWTKNIVASPDGRALFASVGSTATSRRTGSPRRRDAPRSGASTSRAEPARSSRPGCATPWAWTSTARPARFIRW